MEQHFEGIVIYTDGSARPNPGKTGYGAHGYLYTTEPAKRGTGLSTHLITEVGYIPTGTKNKGTFPEVQPVKYFDFFGTSGNIGSNNSAEIDALYFSLDHLKDHTVKKVTVFTDSEYLRRGLDEWVHLWKERNWKRHDGTPVPNAMNWTRLVDLIDLYKTKDIEFSISWVEGHSDVFGNILADRLAVIGCVYSMGNQVRSEFKTSEAQGYWKSEIERHPFINFKRLYFNSTSENSNAGHYFIAEPGQDDALIGKKVPETCYAVIKIDEPDTAIEVVKKKQFEISIDINSVIMMRLDKVFSKEVYPVLMDHGEFGLLQDRKGRLSLNFLDDKPVTVELNPPGLALRAVNSLAELEVILDRYVKYQENDISSAMKNTDFKVHDVTSVFYDQEQKEKNGNIQVTYKLKSEFGVGFKNINIEVDVDFKGEPKKLALPLILGADILPRNNLKRIEGMNPKVYVVTWKESENSFRYASVIKIDGGIGIWSNFYADKIFVF